MDSSYYMDDKTPWNLILRGGLNDGKTVSGLVGEVTVPLYRRTDEIDPTGFIVFVPDSFEPGHD